MKLEHVTPTSGSTLHLVKGKAQVYEAMHLLSQDKHDKTGLVPCMRRHAISVVNFKKAPAPAASRSRSRSALEHHRQLPSDALTLTGEVFRLFSHQPASAATPGPALPSTQNACRRQAARELTDVCSFMLHGLCEVVANFVRAHEALYDLGQPT